MLVFLLSSFCCFGVEKDSTAALQRDTVPAVKKDSEKMLLRTKKGAKLKKVRDPFDTSVSKNKLRSLSFLSHLVINIGGGWHFNDQVNGQGYFFPQNNAEFYNCSLELFVKNHGKRMLGFEFLYYTYVVKINSDPSIRSLHSIVCKYYPIDFGGILYPFIKFGSLPPFMLEGGFGFTLKLYGNLYLNSSYSFVSNSAKIDPDVTTYSTNVILVSLGYNFNFLP